MNQTTNKYQKLSNLLDEQYTWPDYYPFKFIVPVGSLESLKTILKPLQTEIETKLSKKGNYVSVSVRPLIKKTDDVIQIYQDVYTVKGIVVL